MSYSIWLIPSEQVVQNYFDTVARNLSKEHAAPVFEPHLTLLGNLELSIEEVKKKCEEIALQSLPISFKTGAVDYSTTYYQCLFIRLFASPELMELYDLARESFGLTEPTAFMPHISVLYGDFPYKKRHKITLELRFKQQFFTADKLVVTPGGGDPSSWEHIYEVAFSKE